MPRVLLHGFGNYALCHSRESGNPGNDKETENFMLIIKTSIALYFQGFIWIPAFAGMT